MANVRSGNTYYVDSDSDSGTASSFLTERNLKLVGVVFYVDATTDVIELADKSSSAAAVGNAKLKLMSSTAKNVQYWDLSSTPIMFPNGVWVTLTGSPISTLIFEPTGS